MSLLTTDIFKRPQRQLPKPGQPWESAWRRKYWGATLQMFDAIFLTA